MNSWTSLDVIFNFFQAQEIEIYELTEVFYSQKMIIKGRNLC